MRLSPNTTTTAAAAIAMVAVTAGGCSFLFSEGPPANSADRAYFTCAESHAPPIIDTVVAGLGTLTAVLAKRTDQMTEEEYRTAVAVWAGTAVLTGAAAIYGYSAVGRCREAKAQHAMAAMTASRLPAPYGIAPWGAPPPMWPPLLPAPPPAPTAPPPITPPPPQPPTIDPGPPAPGP
jgi:hypothetical protein